MLGVLFMFMNIVMVSIVVAFMLMGEHQSLLRIVECLCLMFILSCLGLAADHVPLFDNPVGVLEPSSTHRSFPHIVGLYLYSLSIYCP